MKVKYVNISGSTISSFTYNNFSLTAEHDLPNSLVYVLLNTTCPRYMTTNIVSFWYLSTNVYKTCPKLTALLGFAFILNLENRTILWPFQSLVVIQRGVQCSWVGTSRTYLVWQHGPKEDWHRSLKFINPTARVLNMLNSHFYLLIIFKNRFKKNTERFLAAYTGSKFHTEP